MFPVRNQEFITSKRNARKGRMMNPYKRQTQQSKKEKQRRRRRRNKQPKRTKMPKTSKPAVPRGLRTCRNFKGGSSTFT